VNWTGATLVTGIQRKTFKPPTLMTGVNLDLEQRHLVTFN